MPSLTAVLRHHQHHVLQRGPRPQHPGGPAAAALIWRRPPRLNSRGPSPAWCQSQRHPPGYTSCVCAHTAINKTSIASAKLMTGYACCQTCLKREGKLQCYGGQLNSIMVRYRPLLFALSLANCAHTCASRMVCCNRHFHSNPHVKMLSSVGVCALHKI